MIHRIAAFLAVLVLASPAFAQKQRIDKAAESARSALEMADAFARLRATARQ